MSENDTEDRIIRGHEATTLLNSPLMVDVMSAYRRSKLEELAKADPTDTNKITQLQASVSVIDGLREELEAFKVDADDLSREKQSYA